MATGNLFNMRNFVCSFFMILTILPNKQGFGQGNDLVIYKSYFDSDLKSWTKTIKDFKLSSFKLTNSVSFDTQQYKRMSSLKDFYSIYKPALDLFERQQYFHRHL